jgi:hypothetical protein
VPVFGRTGFELGKQYALRIPQAIYRQRRLHALPSRNRLERQMLLRKMGEPVRPGVQADIGQRGNRPPGLARRMFG